MGILFRKFFLLLLLSHVMTVGLVGLFIQYTGGSPTPVAQTGTDAVHPPPPFADNTPSMETFRPPPPPMQQPPFLVQKPLLPPFQQPQPHGHVDLGPLLPIAVGGFTSLAFAFLMAWYFSQPIQLLQRALAAIAGGKLNTRVGTSLAGRKDELASLGADFDIMAERLQRLITGQQRLLHDVSHELRSPLARVQTATELLRQQPPRLEEICEHIERDCSRMDSLIGDILTLARMNAREQVDMTDLVSLSDVIASIAEDADLEAEHGHFQLDIQIGEPLFVTGNDDLLRYAIENILRNAFRYSPPGGSIQLTVCRGTALNSAMIEVLDQGPGIPEDELASLFQPFQRGSQTNGAKGFGLGMAIAQRAVEAHGGQIEANNRESGGLRVSLRLPLAKA